MPSDYLRGTRGVRGAGCPPIETSIDIQIHVPHLVYRKPPRLFDFVRVTRAQRPLIWDFKHVIVADLEGEAAHRHRQMINANFLTDLAAHAFKGGLFLCVLFRLFEVALWKGPLARPLSLDEADARCCATLYDGPIDFCLSRTGSGLSKGGKGAIGGRTSCVGDRCSPGSHRMGA